MTSLCGLRPHVHTQQPPLLRVITDQTFRIRKSCPEPFSALPTALPPCLFVSPRSATETGLPCPPRLGGQGGQRRGDDPDRFGYMRKEAVAKGDDVAAPRKGRHDAAKHARTAKRQCPGKWIIHAVGVLNGDKCQLLGFVETFPARPDGTLAYRLHYTLIS
uniref:Transposase n=1 Tax=Steinernema glaseri TaxID=37863 RepID=A0A1I8A8N0_9BILA